MTGNLEQESKFACNKEKYLMEIEINDILLTIAIPTYNRKNLLKRALDSIVPQLNSKIEVLVSDNASNDGTDEMIASIFPMVRYIKNEVNMGADYNFLQCYREAKGKYIILLGSDDRLADGAIDYFTDYLEKNECALTFVNFGRYDVTKEEVYVKDGEWIKNYKSKHDIVTKDRNCFIKYAGHRITFMSASIVKRSLLMEIKEPERFIGAYFLHTYIMLEATKGKQALFGVVMQPLIEANATKGDSEISKMLDKTFTVFGKCMYHALCSHAVECGFQKKQMRNVYLQYLHDYPFWRLMLSCKRRNDIKVIENFWQDGYPVVKKFPSEWVKVMLVMIAPRCIINMIYKVYKALKKSE